ncbi:carbohydrate kinase family protein [Chitiniphilus purpureus]|uniref:Carbohydrate kinase family protein n=1 Tax=Chitiniphilus purpureus TaxID=2981137 RepID=A0ABY6DNA8_9NEIS|nr:carbohydrate kinase family protein [Chitiniphilus sp. CD1]UXY15693.1 carbohydrate kinase family protein [Chitiniphilus sp. CD1]
MTTLICGSMAYDTIMVFPDRFKNHILPEQIHMLSISFLVPEMRREFGGCAGNIAYTLKALGDEPLIMATVGSDFGPYAAWLDQLGISRAAIRELPEQFTGQCFITTDLDDNQINAFHPGAMGLAHLNRIEDATAPVALAIVSPDGKQGMQEHCRQLADAGIPFIFDPGQGLPMFSGDELLQMIDAADYLACNDYEAELVQQKTGLPLAALACRVKALIVTLGADGARIHADGVVHAIAPVSPAQLLDPTGCGDAFRAGLLYGIKRGWDWQTTGQLASLLGSIKIEHRGPQNHTFTREGLAVRYAAAFGQALPNG